MSRAAISFAMLLNLVAVANAEDSGGALGLHPPLCARRSPETHPRLDRLVGYAMRYFRDFVRPAKRYRAPTAAERAALGEACRATLARCPRAAEAEAIQAVVYEVGRRHFRDTQDKAKGPRRAAGRVADVVQRRSTRSCSARQRGPRFGSFVALYGVAETRALIAKALSGELIARARSRRKRSCLASSSNHHPSLAIWLRATRCCRRR